MESLSIVTSIHVVALFEIVGTVAVIPTSCMTTDKEDHESCWVKWSSGECKMRIM